MSSRDGYARADTTVPAAYIQAMKAYKRSMADLQERRESGGTYHDGHMPRPKLEDYLSD